MDSPTRPKPPNAGKGRPKGSKNRINLAFRDAVSLAFEEMGGVPRLVTWGRKNPTEFYKIAARLIPVEQHGAGPQGEHVVRVVHEFVTVPAKAGPATAA